MILLFVMLGVVVDWLLIAMLLLVEQEYTQPGTSTRHTIQRWTINRMTNNYQNNSNYTMILLLMIQLMIILLLMIQKALNCVNSY